MTFDREVEMARREQLSEQLAAVEKLKAAKNL